jgi:hypothetical protein
MPWTSQIYREIETEGHPKEQDHAAIATIAVNGLKPSQPKIMGEFIH